MTEQGAVRPRLPAALPWAAAFAVALLALLAYEVRTAGAVTGLDGRAEAWLETLSPGLRSGVGALASLPGELPVALLAVAACALGVWREGRRKLAVWAGCIALAGEGAVFVLKQLFHRARPTLAESDFAFPSGHATRATLDYGLVALLLLGPWLGRLREAARRAAVPAWAGLAVLVDAGRVVGGFHWVSDVLAGNALGALLLCLAIAFRPLDSPRGLSREGAPSAP